MIQLLVPLLQRREMYHQEMRQSVGPEFELLEMDSEVNLMEARLRLLDRATSEYVGTLDDDDELDDGASGLAQYVEQNKPLCVMSSSRMRMRGGQVIPYVQIPPQATYKKLARRYFVPHQLIVARREVALAAAERAKHTIDSLDTPQAWIAFDQAYSWELVMTGEMHWYEGSCYRWRQHSDQCSRFPSTAFKQVHTLYSEQFRQCYGSN